MLLGIMGLSCVGKSSLINEVEKRYPIQKVKQYTTRNRRKDIVDNDYIFVSEEQYDELLKANKIISSREFLIKGKQHRYGIPCEVQWNDNYIMAIDVEGYLEISNKVPNMELIKIDSMEEVRWQRYTKRGSTDRGEFNRRDKEDMERLAKIEDRISYYIENNTTIDAAIEEIEAICIELKIIKK